MNNEYVLHRVRVQESKKRILSDAVCGCSIYDSCLGSK